MTVAVIGIGGGGRGARAADDGGADEARADAPAQAVGFGGSGGGSDAASRGKGGDGESGNPWLDRHDFNSVKLRGARCGPHVPIGRKQGKIGSEFRCEILVSRINGA